MGLIREATSYRERCRADESGRWAMMTEVLIFIPSLLSLQALTKPGDGIANRTRLVNTP